MAPMVIPPLRLGTAPVQAQGNVPFDAEESGSYSDEDFAEESDGGNPSPDSAAIGHVHGEGASRSHQDGPTRGREHPNFPVRPGSPQPMMQSPIPSPGRGRGRGAGAAAALDYRGATEEDDEDDVTTYTGAGSRHPGNGRASPPTGYGGAPRRVGGSAPELRPHSMQDEELSEEMHPDEVQHAQMMAEAAHAYPSYSWRETLSRFPSLLRLYPLAASSEAALEAPDSEHNAGRDGSSAVAMGPVDQLEGNEEYLNSHPSAASSARPPASQPAAAPVTQSPKLQSPRQPHHFPAPHQQQTSPAMSSASKAASSTPRQPAQVARPVPLTMLEPSSAATTTAWQGLHPSSVRSSGVPSVPNTPPRTAYVANGAPPVQMMSLATPRSAPLRGAWARPQGIRSGPTNKMFHDDVAAAWAEVEDARREVERRERELELREAALLRAEARNAASARQLSELRRRLEDYSEELEEGVVSLTAQQQAVRDERREASELQARARRLYAAAAAQRDDRLKRSWERRPGRWSHLGATGPI